MKEIIAVVRPSGIKLTKQKLAEKGFLAYTEEKVGGRGKQGGLAYASENGPGIPFLPKRMLTVFVEDEAMETAVAILVEANRTGEIGDGKIFVCPLEAAVRIRTEERDRAALTRS